ncbi:MAG TPA: sulfite exporter TauE/SafE family protein [Sedimentisphaerales bacterium]|nr:sulfite exporter TauE/SafE family protein [Sedimentisphaerales bacterium]
MDYFILVTIGLVMGLFGGLLGIGGSVIMIPALVLAFGQDQHLYQASAMICNFFVGISAVAVHKKADMLLTGVIKWIIPVAALGIIIGVAISNLPAFGGQNSYLLARTFGAFLIYVIVYNCLMFGKSRGGMDGLDVSRSRRSVPLAILCGLLTGVPAGLLGIGGGIVCTPAQQLFLKMPLKRAISNSAATIAAIAVIGALYKNITLARHNILVIESVKIAAIVIPGAIVGSLVGSRLMYKLPKDLVRIVFILLAAVACYKLLTVSPGA